MITDVGFLPMAEYSDFACVLDANGTMLRITAVPEVSRAGYPVLGWMVADISATIRDLIAKGVVFLRYDGMDQDEDGIWTARRADVGHPRGDRWVRRDAASAVACAARTGGAAWRVMG